MPDSTIFFDGSADLVRILVVGVLAYVALVVLLRITGKRTLSKLNAFDLVVTVALGSVLATILLSASVSLAEGVLAFALLVFLQYAVTFTAVRSKKFQNIVKAEPRLLFHNGEFVRGAMRQERLTAEEVRAAIRQEGHDDLEAIGAVVLETDGSLSVLPSPASRLDLQH